MKSSFKKQAERFLREQKDYKRWLAVFLCLAVVVTIGTTAALKYRGIAVTSDDSATNAMHMEQAGGDTEVIPEGMRKHVHTADCYEMQPVLICGMTAPGDETADGVTADAGAGDAANAGAEAPTQGHVHTDACYTVTGGTETLTCTKPEHTHGSECYTTETVQNVDEEGNVTEETVEKLTCTTEEHTHGADCYTVEGGERTLTCTIPEGAEAAPATVAAAETPASTPASTENAAPAAADAAAAPVPEVQADAAATGETVSGHVHTDKCYEMQPVLICGKEEGELEPDVSGNDILSDEMNLVQTAEAGGYTVTVTYSESAQIPETAELRVTEYDKESDEFAKRCDELEYQPDALLNVGFYDGDAEIEPKKPVLVKITDSNVKEAANYEITHFGADGIDEMRLGATETKEGFETEFFLESFSNIAVWANERKASASRSADFSAMGELAHEKTVEPGTRDEDNNINYYDLTLNVKGAAGSRPGNAKLDILFVLDTSGSMAWGVEGKGSKGPSRLEQATTSIENLVTDLKGESGINAQYKLITFATNANTRGAGNWMDGDTLTARLPEEATGGTNYEAALEAAAAAISDGRPDAEQIVIFLTDGAPTYYYNDKGERKGPGSRTDTTCINEAKSGAGKIAATNACEYFYAVGYGAEMTKDTIICSPDWTPKKILEEVAAATNSSKGHYVETTQDLVQFFEKFKQGLTEISAVDVSFTDVLTDKVQIVDADGNPVVNPDASAWVPKVERIETDGSRTTLADGAEACKAYGGMTVEYDESAKKMVVDFDNDYELEENLVYSVTVKIAPTQAAKDEYIANGYKYPEANTSEGQIAGTGRGESYTGSESAGKLGIYCNTEDGAKISYRTQEKDEGGNVTSTSDPRELPYPRPVVQVQGVTPQPEVTQNLPHRKYIAATSETDVYDLTLDVEGSSGGGNYDIVFLVDRSWSMTNGRATLEKSLQNLYAEIDRNDVEKKNQYSMVRFDGGDDDEINIDSWSNSSGFKRTVDNISIKNRDDDESRYSNGLKEVADLMKKRKVTNDGNEKVVIFLTDGIPTDDKKEEHHNKDYWEENDVIYGPEYADAKDEAKNINCDYFYSVKFGNAYNSSNGTTTAETVLDSIANATNNGAGCPGKSDVIQVNGNTVTADQAGSIAARFMGSGFTSKSVVITDALSQWVVPNTVDGAPASLSIKVQNKETKAVVAEASGNINNGVTLNLNDSGNHPLTAKYVNGTVTLNLDSQNGYELNPDYKYSVTIQIRPSDDAYEKALEIAEGNGSYTDEGGTGTDADGVAKNISEGVKGLYTNAAAEVSYVRGDSTEHEGYENPVIVPTLAKLTVKKTVTSNVLTDEDFAALRGKMKFSLDNADGENLPENGEPVNDPENKTAITYTVYNEKWVIPGKHTVGEQGEIIPGYRCTTTRKVSVNNKEQSQQAGLSEQTKASISLKPSEIGLVEFTNHYDSVEAAIGLKKILKDEYGVETLASAQDGIAFTIKKEVKTVSAGEKVEYDPVAEFTIDAEGIGKVTKIEENYTCNGKNKADASILYLEKGTYLVEEVWDNAGPYTKVYPFKLTVNNLGEITIGTLVYENSKDAVTVDRISEGIAHDQITIVNEIMALDELRILKVSAEAENNPYVESAGLPGAEFSLYRKTGSVVDEEKDVLVKAGLQYNSEAGFAGLIKDEKLKNLRVGAYYLKETKAPDGYELLENPIEFEIRTTKGYLEDNVEVITTANLVVKDNGGYAVKGSQKYDVEYDSNGDSYEVWTLAIPNNTGAELPVTGGPGTAAYTFGGLAILIAVSLMYGLNMRRKRGKGGMN